MKNLKKVISTLLALAIVMSSFVAMSVSAASFKDVADTEDYAEAVNALAALGAVNGYEDGTFLPDNNITRAEAITMIVGALNMTADAQKSGSVTDFADVNANAKWAAGYVNVGVAQGFISGISKTEFAPTKNVTYAEMLSMLTRLLGYGNYSDAVMKAAKDAGKDVKWYEGAMEAAKIAGIQTGVASAATADVTRAQVAQLIWNTLQAPKLGVTTVAGKLDNMESEKLNGKKGNDFETLLSEKFDAYVLDVEVVATAKTAGLEAGTVEIQLKSEKDWDAEDEAFVVEDEKKVAFVGKTAAEDYLFSSGRVIAEFDGEDWTLLYFAPTAKIATKAVDGTLVSDKTAADVLKIKKSKISSTTTDYKIKDAALYVNGVEKIAKIDTADEVKELVKYLKVSVGDAVLYEDADAAGRVYNKIMVDVYALASVQRVSDRNDVVTVVFDAVVNPVGANNAFGKSIEITDEQIAEGEVVVTVTKAGEAIELSALKEDDIVAVKFDLTKDFETSTFFDIIATDEAITGKYSSYDAEEELFTIDGSSYEAAQDLGKLEPASTYSFRLDPFGRLFDCDVEATSKLYAIVEYYYNKGVESEYDYLKVMTLDGQYKTLYVDDDAATKVAGKMTDLKVEGKTMKQVAKMPVAERVISYTVKNSTGRVNGVAIEAVEPIVDQEYKAGSNKLGKALAANATVLDASAYVKADAPKASDYKASALSSLVEGTKYNGFLVHKIAADNEYAFVVLTGAGSVFGIDSDFAVAATKADLSTTTLYDDELVYTLRVMKDGATKAEAIMIDGNAEVYSNGTTKLYTEGGSDLIKAGAVFFYTVDAYGLVDRIEVAFAGGYDFANFKAGEKSTVFALADASVDTAEWNYTIDDEKGEEPVQLFLAPVASAAGSNITFGKLTAGKVQTETKYDYVVASDANLYYYDLSDKADAGSAAFSGGFFSGISKSVIDNETGLASFDFPGDIQFAFVMAVDGVVTNAVVFCD